MRRILVAALTGAVLAVAALPAGAVGARARPKTIVQIAAATPQLSTLVKLVKTAGLVQALSGKTTLTVFAPTNAAFAKVPARTLNKLAHNRALLRSVLLYHVAKGALPAAAVERLHTIKTLEGSSVNVSVRHGGVYINQAKVVAANVRASNGIVHVINGVLIPPA
jgi:uncharacterized surface protein with fasciclin (FAS1) repeats